MTDITLFGGCWVKTRDGAIMGPVKVYDDGDGGCGRNHWDSAGRGDQYDSGYDMATPDVVAVYPTLAAASAANPDL